MGLSVAVDRSAGLDRSHLVLDKTTQLNAMQRAEPTHQPRPTNGIPLAMTVMFNTLADNGSPAM